MTMTALVRWIVLSAGWPRRVLAFGAGAIGALAMAPVDMLPAFAVAATVAVWLIDGAARGEAERGWRRLPVRSCRAAAAVGWWWGFGYFVAGLWWIGAAFLVEPEKTAWAMPLGVIVVPAMLAFFPAFGFAFARLLWVPGAGRIVTFAGGLGLSEWLRSWLFTGFPWNNYGMALADHLVLAQLASVIGNGGLTVLVILICAAPATLADGQSQRAMGVLGRVAPTLAGVAALATIAGFGILRLSQDRGDVVPGVRLRILQPAVAQDASFSYANREKILADYLELSDRATSPTVSGLADVTHLIWPESAFPFILARDPDALQTIGQALPTGTVLVTGAARLETSGPGKPSYFNSITAVGSGGTILDSYDKVHLVPFGEYLPFESLLQSLGITHFVHVPGGFTAGTQHRLMTVPGLPPVAPAICYEAIFSNGILPSGPESERQRAGVILNVTNDGWFGATAGPHQHLAQARLRAVEEGLPLIRAANTGISAIIDPYGKVVASLPLNTRNVLDGPLPSRLNNTTYSGYPSAVTALMYGLAPIMGLILKITSLKRLF